MAHVAASALLLLLLLSLQGCGSSADYVALSGNTMGTQFQVTAHCAAADSEVETVVLQALAAVNSEMSTYDEDSELSRFNRAATQIWFPVSAALVKVVLAAEDLHNASNGAFDITVGPLVNLWGFGPRGGGENIPAAQAVEQALDRVGHHHLQTRSIEPALRKDQPVYVDLSAIAKGHGVDRISERLAAMNCTDFLVDVGGEVRVAGVSPRGTPWRVGIEVPDPNRYGSIQKVVVLTSGAIATSGDYRNFLEIEGERYSHTIDPRTGYPVKHMLASVSVVHDSAMWADGYATALNVLGPILGLEMAESEALAAFFLIRTADGFEARYTSAMRQYLADEQ